VTLTPYVVALPLAAAVVLLLTGRRWRGATAGWLATGAVAAAFGLALAVLFDMLSKPATESLASGAGRLRVTRLYEWFSVGTFHVDVALRADPLSAVMILVVTGVGALIFLYSIGYMHADPRFPRFFAYMSLFVFFMLLLVLADNFLLLYVGWEGVGLCSYLLIGYWFERPSAAAAAKKAFVVTRVGDAALLIGIVFIWVKTHSLAFDAVFAAVRGLPQGTATVIALLLLAGAAGKSAQLPLHTWLPDAMEGPTPVSALIHAATMVTAGVYLVVRAAPIFDASVTANTVVAVIGVATALYAALSAVAQDDIKRALAYSTMSQVGLMFFGAGMGDPAAAIFLLVVHAFFKALLFMSAGSVIHGLRDEQDMMRMGGLRRPMPFTATMWIVAALAIAGVPPLAGFFAKDQDVAAASLAGRPGFWIVALLVSLLTAVYIGRATFMTFFGAARYSGEPREPGFVMRAPMALLAVGAAFGGLLGLSETSGAIYRFLAPVASGETGTAGPSELEVTTIAVVVALAGVAFAWFVWGSDRIDWVALRVRFAGLKRLGQSGFYVDDVYATAIGGGGELGAAVLAWLDRVVVDGAVNLFAEGVGKLSAGGRRVQTGFVRTYALAFLLGVVGVLWFLVARSP
jgi:NADH-quinone oxidoreductase subunit L